MALIFIGKSVCPICKNVLHEGEAITGFPAFVPNNKDPIYFFNDGGFHQECVPKHEFGNLALKSVSLDYEKVDYTRKICLVSKERIAEMDDYFNTGLLTSDEHEPLYPYNFITLHKKYIKDWELKEDLLQKLIAFKENDRWNDYFGGRLLDDMIETIKNPIP
ncbi:hypothetical protein [Paraflavitalea sp. CAU 1676]|uniref:hypothetical protein n=1 Tax=Paraflavitalea sp. CAU 1676 TaxID=3032598 RepID=UPI0023DAD88D|nr:hypothetical protein [Paraflavitalea sp. CAU 1676]MDF2188611.1 hypothetical protein [Paraflavitalea sp. CAU 1676]